MKLSRKWKGLLAGCLVIIALGAMYRLGRRVEARLDEIDVAIAQEQARIEPIRQELDLEASLERFTRRMNPGLAEWEVETIVASILESSERYGLDPKLVAGVVYVESRGDRNAKNKGCLGIMQVNFPVWRDVLVSRLSCVTSKTDLFGIATGIEAGSFILRHYLDRRGTVRGALYAYSGGATWYPDKVLDAVRKGF